ncbi:MAG: helix-turn-helix domain-containing protein [Peptostreptococcaceae bacterium]|nr:helix-turn-helix domain-containing protein [Peptostreptococcaceae bacterium]
MDKFGKKLKKLRMDNNVSAYKLCEDLHIHRGTLSNWETGKRTPDSDTLLKIANYFNVTLDYLLGNEKGKRKKYKGYKYDPFYKFDAPDELISKNELISKFKGDELIEVPVFYINNSTSMFADENIIGYEIIHREELQMGKEYFYLQVKGDSMANVGISDRSRVLIRVQDYIENNGDIMAVKIGNELTLKRVYKQDAGLLLQSENVNYDPIFYPTSDVESGHVGIIGRAIKVEIKL